MGYREERAAKAVKMKQLLGTDEAAARAFQAKGPRGLALTLGLTGSTRPDTLLEGLTHAIFEVQQLAAGSYPLLLAEIARAWMVCPITTTYGGWSHSLCHLFEDYDRGTSSSFLNAGVDLAVIAALAGNAVDRAAETEKGCIARIVGPMIDFCFDNLTAETLDAPFPLVPASTNNTVVANMLDEQYYGDIKLYLAGCTPRALVTWKIEQGEYLDIPADRLVAILAAVKGDVNDAVFDAYLTKYLRSTEDATSSLEEISALTATIAQGAVMEGVFVDVDGVLIVNGKLNDEMLQQLTKHVSNGETITVFSGGDPATQTERLRALGCPEDYLPVSPKSAFHGKILGTVYDDTKPAFQGFSCVTFAPVYGAPVRYDR